jgi:hypothetical protein
MTVSRSPVFQSYSSLSTLNDWNVEINGLLMGPGTPYGIISIDGLDTPDFRVDDTVKMGDHGDFLFANYADKRVITTTADAIGVPATGDFENVISGLRAAVGVPQPDYIRYRYKKLGEPTRVAFVKPTRGPKYLVDVNYNIGNAQWASEMQAGDPRIYDDVLQALTTNPEVDFGFTFSVSFSIDFLGGTTGTVNCLNTGSVEAPWLARIAGPATDIAITHLSLGRRIRVITTLGVGDYLEIDSLARTIMLNGQASRYGSMDPTSQWFGLLPVQISSSTVPGNPLLFQASGTSGSTNCTVIWRSAWM